MPQYATRKLMCAEDDARRFDKNTCIIYDKIKLWFQPNKEGKTKLRVYVMNHYWLAWTYNRFAEEALCTYAQARRAIRLLKAAGLIRTLRKRFNGTPITHVYLIGSPAFPPPLRLVRPRRNTNNSTDLSFEGQNPNDSTDLSRPTVMEDKSDLSQKTDPYNRRSTQHESEKENPLPPRSGGENIFSPDEEEGGNEDMPDPQKIGGVVGGILEKITVVKDDDVRLTPSLPALSVASNVRPAPTPTPRQLAMNPRALGNSPRQIAEKKRIEKEEEKKYGYRKQLGMRAYDPNKKYVIAEEPEKLYEQEAEQMKKISLVEATKAVQAEIKAGKSEKEIGKEMFPEMSEAELGLDK